MRDIPSDNSIKNFFDNISLPPIDVSQITMQRIYQRKMGRKMYNSKKLIIGILLSAIFLFTVGFAAIQVWDLKGPGNLSYKYQLLDSGDTLSVDIYKAEFENLDPGKVLAIMKTKDNPKNTIHLRFKPLRFQRIDELSSKVGSRFKSPIFLPQGYVFCEGTLNYAPNDSYKTEMIEKSKISDKDYIIQGLEPSDDVLHYDMIYKESNKTIMLNAFFNYPYKDIYDIKTDHKVTKINVNNFEAIYVEHDGISEITWLEDQDGSTTQYSIRSTSIYANTKDDLLKIAESLK